MCEEVVRECEGERKQTGREGIGEKKRTRKGERDTKALAVPKGGRKEGSKRERVDCDLGSCFRSAIDT